jgi:hypothetical protein
MRETLLRLVGFLRRLYCVVSLVAVVLSILLRRRTVTKEYLIHAHLIEHLPLAINRVNNLHRKLEEHVP